MVHFLLSIMLEFKAPNGDEYVFTNTWGDFPVKIAGVHYFKIGDEELRFIDFGSGKILHLSKMMYRTHNLPMDGNTIPRYQKLIEYSVMDTIKMNLLNPTKENLEFLTSCESLLTHYLGMEQWRFKKLKFVLDRYKDVGNCGDLKFELVEDKVMDVTWTSTLTGEQKKMKISKWLGFSFEGNADFDELCEMISRKLKFFLHHEILDEVAPKILEFLTRNCEWPKVYGIVEVSLDLQMEINKKRNLEEAKNLVS